MSERLKEHDWKSCRRSYRLEGSNPSLSAIPRGLGAARLACYYPADSAVREASVGRVLRLRLGDVAQLGEHLVRNEGVGGSNPLISTIRFSLGQAQRDPSL